MFNPAGYCVKFDMPPYGKCPNIFGGVAEIYCAESPNTIVKYRGWWEWAFYCYLLDIIACVWGF